MAKKSAPVKRSEVIRGFTIKYHANGKTRWSRGKILDGQPQGYWEWYRPDGTLKRSGHFQRGEPVGAWTTYDSRGHVYKITEKKSPTSPKLSKSAGRPSAKRPIRKRTG